MLSHTHIQRQGHTKLHRLQELFQSKGVSVNPVSLESQLIVRDKIAKSLPLLRVGQQIEIMRIIVGTCLGDWVSYYMALMTGVNPSPVPHITELKDVP